MSEPRTRFRPRVESCEDRTAPAVFTVTNASDAGAGSLRDAIARANANPDADTIQFAPPLAGQTVNLSTAADPARGSSALVVSSPVTIAGTGQTLTRAGTAAMRLFTVTAGGDLTLRDLTLGNGLAQGATGGTLGTTGVPGSPGLGGAVLNRGTLQLYGCTLTGNAAVGGANTGGGLPVGVGGFVGVGMGGVGGSAATPGDRAGRFAGGKGSATGAFGGGGGGLGGAIYNEGGTLVVANTTFHGNTARGGNATGSGATGGSGFGAAIFNANGTVRLTHVTAAANVVAGGTQSGTAAGGALYTASLDLTEDFLPGTPPPANAVASVGNSILSETVGGSDVTNDRQTGTATLAATGPNFAGITLVNRDGTFTGPFFTIGDPLLRPLAANGGPTQTMLPAPTSPVVDAGANDLLVAANVGGGEPFFDQRGLTFGRVSRGKADLGAVEVQFPPALAGGTPDGKAQILAPVADGLALGDTLTFFPNTPVVVRTATADVTGDGVPDFVGVTGPGVQTQLTVLDGRTRQVVASFSPFEAGFTGGQYVAAADLNGDGKAEVVVTPDVTGGPLAAVYDGARLAGGSANGEAFGQSAQVVRFFGIDDVNFRGGARPALGDVNGDGTSDLVLSAGFLGGPRIAVFSGAQVIGRAGELQAAQRPDNSFRLVTDFFAFETTVRNGAFVAVGDLDGDGFADLGFGGGPSGGPRVRAVSGKVLLGVSNLTTLDAASGTPGLQLANFLVGDPATRGGIRVALRDVTGDRLADLLTSSGDALPAQVQVFDGTAAAQTLTPFNASALANGVFVG